MFDEKMGNCFVKKTTRQYPMRIFIALVSYIIVALSLVSSPLLVTPFRFSFMRLVHHLVHHLVPHLVLDIATRRPRLIHLISYRCHLATSQIPTSANTDKNELDKTAQPYRPPPRRVNRNTGNKTPSLQHRMTTREHHRRRPRRPRPTRAAIRHESDTTRRDRTNNDPRNKTRHQRHRTPQRDTRQDNTQRRNETKRKTQNATTRRCYKTHKRDDERDERRDEEREEKQDEKTKRRHEKHNETPHIY